MNVTKPDWTALERAVGLCGLPLSTLGAFMWMGEQGGVHLYKHRDTRNYAKLRVDDLPVTCREQVKHAVNMGERWPDAPRRPEERMVAQY